MSIQLSPDRKWIWDGNRWLPIPSVAPDSPGAQELTTNLSPPPAAPSPAFVPVSYSPPASQPPAPVYTSPAAEAVTPLWEEPVRSGISKYLYVVAGAVVLIMAMMFLNSQTFVQLPWLGSSSDSTVRPTPAPSPPPLLVRSEYARAGSFLTYTVAPALAGVNQTLPSLGATCNALSNSCLSAITVTDKQVKGLLSVIDRAAIPPCIATGVAKMRTDVAGMESALQLSLSGFKDNKKSVVDTGLSRFASLTQTVHADSVSLDQAQKAQCSPQQLGP